MNWNRYVSEIVTNTLNFMTVPIKILEMKRDKLVEKHPRKAEGMDEAIQYLKEFFEKGKETAQLVISRHLDRINQICALEEAEYTQDPTKKDNN